MIAWLFISIVAGVFLAAIIAGIFIAYLFFADTAGTGSGTGR